jgi:hypothetical protein
MNLLSPVGRTKTECLVPVVIAVLLLIPTSLLAETEPKKFNLGLGYYSLQLYDETWSYDSKRMNGAAFTGAYMFSDQIALRASYYVLRNGDFTNTDTEGMELLGYYGRGLATRGGKVYAGAGYFTEDWDDTEGTHQFDGLQLMLGAGYNWDRVAFDAIITLRDVGDYDDYLGRPDAEINTAGVLSLMLSARF